MGEMPDAGAPVLQVDVAELGAGADDEFDGAAVETLESSLSPPAVSERSVASAPSSRITRMWLKSTAPAVADMALSVCSGSSIFTPLGT